MKNRIKILIAGVSALVITAMIGNTTSYLKDYEIRENVITIGSINLELNENPSDDEPYTDAQTVVTGSVVKKAPKLINRGNCDEYVFLKVEVPEKNVTLLYEDGENEGRIIQGEPKYHQLFKVLTTDKASEIEDTFKKDVIFSYHGADEKEGWILLRKEDESDGNDDVYIFGYSRKLAPQESTVSLFDSIQLRSFIEYEVSGTQKINVFAYGIQTDNLDIDGLDEENPGENGLEEIFRIVERKAAQQNE